MATFVQSKGGGASASATTLVVTFTNTTVSGNSILVYFHGQTATPTSVTDNKGNTYTKDLEDTTNGVTQAWRSDAASGGASHQVTANFSSNSLPRNMNIVEHSGLTSSSFDQSVVATGNTSSLTSSGNTATLSQADETIVGIACIFNGAATVSAAGSGFGNLLNTHTASNYDTAYEDKTVSATTAVAATVTWSAAGQSCKIICLTYKISTASSANVTDSVTITENIGTTLAFNVNVNDSITVTENIGRTLAYNANVNDTVTLTENLSSLLVSQPNVSDTITVSESPIVAPQTSIVVADSVSLTESYSLPVPGIQFTGASNSGYQATASSYNWSHTVASGNNRILVVDVALLNVANSVTGITYNSVALTKLRHDVSVSGTVRTEIWYLVNSSTGSNSVAVTLNTNSVSASSASSYINVDPSNPVDAQNGGTDITGAGGGSASVSTTTLTNMAWVVDAIATPDTAINSAQRERNNVTGAVGSGGQADQGPVLTAGATTSQWNNIAALTTWTMSTMALRPFLDTVFVNVSDSITVSESTNETQVFNASVSDTVTLSENLILLLVNLVLVSDAVTLSESIGTTQAFNVTVSETITVTENVITSPQDYIAVSDTITITEISTVRPVTSINVNDQVSVSENVLNGGAPNPSVSDNIIVSEAVMIVDVDGIAVMESISVTESVNVALAPPSISVSDTVTVNEVVTPQVNSYVNVSNTVTVTEAVVSQVPVNILVSDTVSLSESLGLLAILFITVSDNIMVTESIARLLVGFVSVSDNMTVSESVNLLPLGLSINVSDTITISESVSVTASQAPQLPYRLLNPLHRYTGPRGSRSGRSVRGPRPTRGPRS